MNKKTVLLGILCLGILATSNFTLAAETLVIEGSNTVYPIANLAAARFQEIKTDITVTVGGAGSGAGIAALINGQCDIADASRYPKESEILESNSSDVDLIVHTIAKDGIVIIVHPDNPIAQLSQQQITDIYNGTITAWSDLGISLTLDGIKVLERDENSGTHDYFNEAFLAKQEVNSSNLYAYGQYASTSQLFEVVATEINAIGYGGLGYVDETIKAVRVDDGTGTFIAPSVATVKDGSYPISRPLYMITDGEPAGLVKEFIDFVMSYEGQSIVYYTGYIPVGEYTEDYNPTEGLPTSFGFIAIPLAIGITALSIRNKKKNEE
jgi:phosphate transport system substrate-binding protein